MIKSYLKFLIPSIIGILLFITPITYDGNLTIPIAVISNALLNIISPIIIPIIYIIILVSVIPTIIHFIKPIKFIKDNEFLNKIYTVTPFWLVIRIIGLFIATLLVFNINIEIFTSMNTGGLVLYDLIPILVCVFLLAGFLLPLLLDFGLLDFFGALLTKVMRPIFNLPGRSALDCLASWLGDGSIGVLLTSKQYEEGFYSKKEATIIATTFSFVSITFALVVISEVALQNYFSLFYLTVFIAGIVVAMIVPRIPPLSKVENTYCVKKDNIEKIPEGISSFKHGLNEALKTADNSPSLNEFIKSGLKNVLEMWLSTIPVIMAMGTLTLIVAEYTPIFDILGLPFIPLYNLLQIPYATEASSTVIVGFADMFLPSVMASTIPSELTRFVVACTSVTQLIYMSEIGSIILGSSIKISPLKLFIIFIERTIISLPIIALIGHLIF